MATPAQIEANRRNAQKSTGPKTEEGKAASCLNARKHGFRGEFFFCPGENQEEFWDLHASFMEEWQPSTASEESLVQMLTENFWHRKRAQMLVAIYDNVPNMARSQQVKEIARQMKYMGQYERAFQRNLRSLQIIRKERQREEIGFERTASNLRTELRKEQTHDLRIQAAKARLKKLEEPKPTPRAAKSDTSVLSAGSTSGSSSEGGSTSA